MESKWEKFKKTVKGALSNVAARTSKYARIGKAKIGKINIKNSVNSTFRKLGLEVYNQISDGTKGDVSQSNKVKALITKIDHHKQSINDKNLEIETIKQESLR